MGIQNMFWIVILNLCLNPGNAVQFTNLPATVSVNTTATGQIFQATTDAPQGSAVLFLAPVSSASAYFSLDQNTGAVTVNPGVTLQSGTYTFDNIVPLMLPVINGLAKTLTIEVTDSAPQPSIFSQETYLAFPISNTANTQVYGPATNFVTNPSPGSTIIYSLDTTTNSQYFNVNSLTGNIVFSQNYNVAVLGDAVTIVLRATSSAGYEDTAYILVRIPDQSNLPAIPNLPATVDHPENSPINNPFYTVNPPLLNGVPIMVTFTLTQSPTSPVNLFSINPTTGQVTTNTGIDYEALTHKTYMLEITAADFSGKSSMSTLTVIVTDVNEPPMLSPTSYNLTTTPGPMGKIVVPGTILSGVVDPDANDTLSFQLLTSTNAQYFTLNPTTGEISYAVDNSLDFIQSPVTLKVLVTDEKFQFLIVDFDIIIDSSNMPPLFSNLPQTIDISESQTAGSTFFIVIATDPDLINALTYSLPTTSPENLFNIDPNTGALSMKFTDTLVGLPSPTSINIKVSDGIDETTGTLTLSINQGPVFSNLPATVVVPLSQASGVEFFTSLATDPNGNGFFFIINPATNPQDMFHVDVLTGGVSIADGKSLSSLPITTTSVNLDVGVVAGSNAAQGVLTIIIDRSNSNIAPILTNLPHAKDMLKTTPLNSVIFTVTASDPGDVLSYSLSGQTAQLFYIDPTSGDISTTQDFGFFLTNTVLSLDVTVSDGSLNDTETLNITLVDGNVAPVINNLPTVVPILNNIPIGSSVFTVDATDSNGDTLAYSLTGPGSTALVINPNTGEISTTFDLTVVTLATNLTVDVTVSDGLSSTTQALTLTISPFSNVPPVINNLPTIVPILNNIPIGSSVFTVDATDSNGDTLTYSLTGPGSTALVINPNTGEISTTFDFTVVTMATNLTVDVSVSDGLSSTSQPLTLALTPFSSNVAPVIYNLPANKTILNTTPIGSPLFAVVATDVDGDTLTYSLTGPASSFFSVNATGQLILTSNIFGLTGNILQLTINVDDGTDTVSKQLTLNVIDSTSAPVFTNIPEHVVISRYTAEGSTIIYTVMATDPNLSGNLIYSLLPNTKFAIHPTTGDVTLKPGANLPSLPFGNIPYVLNITVSNGILTTSENLNVVVF